jgi:two-component system response regulator
MEDKFTILLVEDNAAHAELIIRGIQRKSIMTNIIHMEDGEYVLDYIYNKGIYTDKKKYPRPHLLLLDLRLPKIDGLELLIEIKKNSDLLDIPVVVLTTSEAEKDIVRAYENHVNSYLVKPIEFPVLEKLLDDLSLYWLKWNRKPLKVVQN